MNFGRPLKACLGSNDVKVVRRSGGVTFDYDQVWPSWNPWAAIPANYNLGAALTADHVRAGNGSRPAIHWENAQGESRSFNFSQLDALSNRLASSLARLGIRRGDRVFLRLPNVPELYISVLAAAKLGGIFIPSSTQFRRQEVEYRLKDSGAVAAITTTSLVGEVESASSGAPELKQLIVLPYPEPIKPNREFSDFNSLIEQGSEAFASAATANGDPSFIIYTSGTTGDPKGVVHCHRFPIAYNGLVKYWHDFQPNDVVACPSEPGWMLPFSSGFMYPLAQGVPVVFYDSMGARFDPERWFGLIEKYKITNFVAPPTLYRMIMASSCASRRFDLSRWRHATSAGEPLPADTLDSIRREFGVTPLDGIGMSECMVYCFSHCGMPVKPGSCGRPGPGTVIEIMDDDMIPVSTGEEGVLCIRRDTHPGMMLHYWNKPERTAEVFRGEWYFTGDVFVKDEDGYFWFKGRCDDIMKASGCLISPFEVESCLVSHPAVLEAAAVESPDAVRGTVVKAFVVLRSDSVASDALANEIRDYAKRTIAPYKCPRLVEFVTSLPKTTSGKIKRRELRELERNRRIGE
jgi:acetyl-CoA synthetase